MNIIAAFKVVYDDQDIQVASDGTLDYSKAHRVVSAYDLNALEAAAQLGASVEGSHVLGITVGDAGIDESKLKKNVLARGIDELYMVADDACADMDASKTAAVLADMLGGMDAWDIIICGDGSADDYAQQVDVQLAAHLGVPSVNGVTKLEAGEGSVVVERTLEDVVETVEVPLPAVISVAPDVALPRIPGMKDILAAGKKPMNVSDTTSVVPSTLDTLWCRAPKQADRKLDVMEASADGALEKFAHALKAAL